VIGVLPAFQGILRKMRDSKGLAVNLNLTAQSLGMTDGPHQALISAILKGHRVNQKSSSG
jgi:hypothetical protein